MTEGRAAPDRRRATPISLCGLAAVGVIAVAQGALAGDPAWGAYLAGTCVTCHAADGADRGIPSITGWPEADFAEAMIAYRDRARPHEAMQTIAASLSDDEIAALAAYFAALR